MTKRAESGLRQRSKHGGFGPVGLWLGAACVMLFVAAWWIGSAAPNVTIDGDAGLNRLDAKGSHAVVDMRPSQGHASEADFRSQPQATRNVRQGHGNAGANAEQSAQRAPRAWLEIPRARRPLGKLFALAPLGVKTDYLVRHVVLNPADRVLDQASLDTLVSLIERHHEVIDDGFKEYGLKRHAILKDLDKRGELTEMTLDSLNALDREAAVESIQRKLASQGDASKATRKLAEWMLLYERRRQIKPGASAFLMKKDRMLVATSEQLTALEELAARYAHLRAVFLYETLAWFISAGLTDEASVLKIVVEFDSFV